MAPALSIYSFLVFMISLSYGQQNVSSSISNTVETKSPGYSTQSTLASLSHYTSRRPTLNNQQTTQALATTTKVFTSQHFKSSASVMAGQSGELSTSVPQVARVPSTTVTSTTVLSTTVISTTVPNTTLPSIAVPNTTVPSTTTVPNTTVPNVPNTTVPNTTVPSTNTVPNTTVPSTSVPNTTVPNTNVPSTTVPNTTVPSTTVPNTTVPNTTLPSTTVPNTTVRNIPYYTMKSSSPSGISFTSTLFPTTTTKQPVSGQNNSPSAQPASSTVETSSNHVFNGASRPSISTLTSNPVITSKPTSIPAVLSQTSSEVMPKSSSTHLTASSRVVNRASSKIMASLTYTPPLPSTSFAIDQTSSKVMANSTSNSASLNLTSTSRVVKSMMSSTVVTSQTTKERPTVIPSLSPNRTNHIMMSSTAAIQPSCYTYNNSLTCTRLQPSSTLQYNSTSRGAASPGFVNSTSLTSGNHSSTATNKPTKGSPHEEKKHTSLIVGLAVGLSLFVVIVVLFIVYYRRKRASYQYNVFYDEQNIVMHPFDYSK